MSLRGYVCHASPCARCVCRHTFFLHALKEKQLHPPSRAEQKQTEASLHQGFAKVAPIGSKPPPQINKERVAAVARPHALFLFFGAGRGRGKRLFLFPQARIFFSLPRVHSKVYDWCTHHLTLLSVKA